MDRFHAMRAFVRVADAGSFARAARELNMSPPAVTRAISALEDLVGARLFTRTTRSVQLTEAGTRYFEDSKRILGDIAEAEAAAAGSYATPTGTLTITASVMFGQIYIMPIVTEFLEAFPGVTARLIFLDRVTNLVDEGMDVAIRIGHLPDSSYSAVKVGTVRRVICGSPDYFRKHGVPRDPADLTHHRIISATTVWPTDEWRFGRGTKRSIHVRPQIHCNSNAAVIAAVREGHGLSRVLSYQIGQHLIDGALQTVLDDFEEELLPVHVVHPEGRHASAKVRSFVDFAAARLRANRLIN
ncbi:MAG: LysR family transcriptional regulator [Blastomonas sp.]